MRKWLKDLRKNKGWTQAHVAEKLGVTSAQYAYIEAGERQADLNLSTLIALSEIFKISVSKIIKYERALKDTLNSMEELQ